MLLSADIPSHPAEYRIKRSDYWPPFLKTEQKCSVLRLQKPMSVMSSQRWDTMAYIFRLVRDRWRQVECEWGASTRTRRTPITTKMRLMFYWPLMYKIKWRECSFCWNSSFAVAKSHQLRVVGRRWKKRIPWFRSHRNMGHKSYVKKTCTTGQKTEERWSQFGVEYNVYHKSELKITCTTGQKPTEQWPQVRVE